MTDPRLIDELVRRAKVSAGDAEAVLDALALLAAEGRFNPATQFGRGPLPGMPGAPLTPAEPFVPTREDVDALIAEARRHPLGIDFLLAGHLGTVAVTFKSHAFTVEAARARLWSER
jgi:hypothetical protein